MGPFLQVGGSWDMVQSNGFRVAVTITQTDDQLSASATHSGGQVESLVGSTGTVTGPHFDLTINWNNGTRGHYTADLTHGPFTPPPSGFLRGSTQDLDHPTSTATWESEGLVAKMA